MTGSRPRSTRSSRSTERSPTTEPPMFAPLELVPLARICMILAAVTLPLSAAENAVAGSASRDHRGANGAPEGGVTVNGKKAQGVQSSAPLGGPKNKGGFD